MPDFSNNKDLKYLTSELLRLNNNEQRVQVFLRYLECCRFNAKFSPEAVIQFNEDDAHRLGLWAVSQRSHSETSLTEVPEVKKERKRGRKEGRKERMDDRQKERKKKMNERKKERMNE